jgi:hypothetical protein
VRLAVLLSRTLGEIERLPASELSEWMAAENLGLLPDSHLQTGLVCATVANSMGVKRRVTPADFMPRPPRRAAPGDREARIAAFRDNLDHRRR